MTTISEEFVELYTLGLLTPEGRRLVEEAFDASPEVQRWFLERNELPEHVLEEEAHAEVLDQLAAFRGELANPADRELFAFVAEHASPPPDLDVAAVGRLWLRDLRELIGSKSPAAHQVFSEVASRCESRMRARMDFTPALQGAPAAAPTFSTGPAGKEICEQDTDSICIAAPESLIPHGLAWLGIAECDRTVTMHLPELEKVGDYWVGRESIVDLLRGRNPVSPIELFLVPATAANRAEFDDDEVRRFVNALRQDGEQRRAASRYLMESSLS